MPSPCPRVGPSAVTRPGRQLEPHSCRGGHRALFTLLEANPLCRVARRSSALPLSRSRFLGCRITAAPELLKIFLAARCRDKTERRGCCGEGRLAISTTVRSENILPPLPAARRKWSYYYHSPPILALARKGLIPSDKLAGRGLPLSYFIFPFLIPSLPPPNTSLRPHP